MARRLLFVIFMYSFHKIQVEAVDPPILEVNSPVITETDSVTINCRPQTPVTVSKCYFYTLSGGNIRIGSCRQTLTGTELLLKSHQSPPAEVRVRCFYTVKHGEAYHPSPHSETSSIKIRPVKQGVSEAEAGDGAEVTTTHTMQTLTKTTEGQSQMPPAKPALTMTTDNAEKEAHVMQTKPATTMTTGQTVSRYHASTPVTSVKQTSGLTVGRSKNTGSFISSSLTTAQSESVGWTADKTSTKASFITITTLNLPPETWTWKLVVIAACFGGAIFLGLALLCTKRRTGRCSNKRTQATVTDDLPMRNLDHGGLLPAGNDEAYSVITSAPSADCPTVHCSLTGSEKLKRQDSRDQESDIYHMYASISDEPPPSALKDMVYSTLQAH